MLSDEWASVLELSCMWEMSKVREMAVKEILRLHNQAGTDCQKVLLKLSNRLGIKEIRDAVIQALYGNGALGPVEQIQLGTEYQVDSWLLEGYTKLVLMKEGITAEHEEHLGWKTTSKLFRVRDAYLLQMQYPVGGFTHFDFIVTPLVREIFAEELKAAGWGG